jgi:transmembrane sensor
MPDEKEIANLLLILKDASQPDEVRHKALQQLLAHEDEVQSHLRKDFTAQLPESDGILSESTQAYDRLRQQLHMADQRPAQKIPRTISLYRRWASIAAAVLLCIAGAWFFKSKDNKKAGIAIVTPTPPPSVSPVTNNKFDTLRNSGPSTTFHRLQDGSTVHLEPHSQLTFRNTFAAGKKEIFLQGSATFAVHKEAGRPFSVFVNGIEVMDLGTVFSITTRESLIKVRLIQGRVVVRPVNPRFKLHDISLVPGEEFRIDTATRQYAVNFLSPSKRMQDSKLSSELSFKNASLQDVFDKVGKACGVTIHFNKADIKDKSFTGTFNAGSDTRHIINTICMINDLKYELTSNNIHVHQ